jgi:hypothetical protein
MGVGSHTDDRSEVVIAAIGIWLDQADARAARLGTTSRLRSVLRD